MSAKDDFFRNVGSNAQAKRQREAANAQAKLEKEEALQRSAVAYQKDTEALIAEIKSWFDNSPIQATLGKCRVNGFKDLMPSLTLKNGTKGLTITPLSLSDYSGSISGKLDVELDTGHFRSNGDDFSIRWVDSQWTITKPPSLKTEFNQENFFTFIKNLA